MNLIPLFTQFWSRVMTIELFDITLFQYLIFVTVFTIIFQIFKTIGNKER